MKGGALAGALDGDYDRPRLRAISGDCGSDGARSKVIAMPAVAHVPKPLSPGNVESMRGVMKQHREAVENIQPSAEFHYLKEEARQCWETALKRGAKSG